MSFLLILPIFVGLIVGQALFAMDNVDEGEGNRGKLVVEELSYDVTWLGIKVGELSMRLFFQPVKDVIRKVEVKARATNIFTLIHPGEDTFEIDMSEDGVLPVAMRQVRVEHGAVTKRKTTRYDQEGGGVEISRNEEPTETISVGGTVHNEFTSFLHLRRLSLRAGDSFVVPTFADRKRHEVKVLVEAREEADSVFGRIETVRVRPIITFKGLYDKTGDSVIWFTDDDKKIPVRINARIVIGSLTSTLTGYAKDLREDMLPRVLNSL